MTGIMGRTQTGSAALAEQYGCAVYDRYKDLLAEVDIVDICTPTNLHYDMVVQAAKAGKHIICEKPIALTVERGRAMIDVCYEAGVRLFLAQVVRFVPEYRDARDVVTAGQIGDPSVIRLTRVSYQPFKATDNWFVDEDRSAA